MNFGERYKLSEVKTIQIAILVNGLLSKYFKRCPEEIDSLMRFVYQICRYYLRDNADCPACISYLMSPVWAVNFLTGFKCVTEEPNVLWQHEEYAW